MPFVMSDAAVTLELLTLLTLVRPPVVPLVIIPVATCSNAHAHGVLGTGHASIRVCGEVQLQLQACACASICMRYLDELGMTGVGLQAQHPRPVHTLVMLLAAPAWRKH